MSMDKPASWKCQKKKNTGARGKQTGGHGNRGCLCLLSWPQHSSEEPSLGSPHPLEHMRTTAGEAGTGLPPLLPPFPSSPKGLLLPELERRGAGNRKRKGGSSSQSDRNLKSKSETDYKELSFSKWHRTSVSGPREVRWISESVTSSG